MYNHMGLSHADVSNCGAALSRMGEGAGNMEEVANKIVRHLYDQMTDQATGGRSFALVRFYKTHPYGQLDEGLREFARGILGSAPQSEDMNCLTLLATAGDKPEWNSRGNSSGHKAIPLASTDMVAQIPMIWQLLSQFGVNVNSVLKADPALIAEMESKSYGTFHVAEAAGSPYILAQDDFVLPNGVKSVLAFGGVLASGHLFATIMFSKTAITSDVAGMFGSMSSDVKQAVLPYESRVFAG